MSKAETLAKRINIPCFSDDAEGLLKNEELDFIAIISDVDTYEKFTLLCAKYGLYMICQKPLATGYAASKRMIEN